MWTAETRLFVIRQSTNERWARRALIGRGSAVINTLFTLAMIAVGEHFASADVCWYLSHFFSMLNGRSGMGETLEVPLGSQTFMGASVWGGLRFKGPPGLLGWGAEGQFV